MMIYDVTVPIGDDIPVWPSDPPLKLTPVEHRSADDRYSIRLTRIEMGSHTGTHIDAPWHFLADGRKLDEIPLDVLVGEASVVPMPNVRSIGRAQVEALRFDGVERILFKTENSRLWESGTFHQDFVYLEPEAAQTLVERGVRLVGIDYLSIDGFHSKEHPTHFVLLEKNVVILEGLNLSRVQPGRYRMAALPLNLQGADGAPARVILMDL